MFEEIKLNAKKNFRKKDKFQPDIINNSYNQDPKNEFLFTSILPQDE